MEVLTYIALAIIFLPAIIFITGFFDPEVMLTICAVIWYLIGLPAIFGFWDKGEYEYVALIVLALVGISFLQNKQIKKNRKSNTRKSV